MTFDNDIKGLSLHVVGFLCAANRRIVRFRSVSAVDSHRNAEVVTDSLQLITLDKVHINQDFVGAVLTPELAHLEITGYVGVSILFQGKLFHR